MARINLLPWREEARLERQRQYVYSLLGTLVLGSILVLMVGLFFDQRISHQEARNQQIQVEINRLQLRINRIIELEKTRDRLISRKQVIESLQASRSLTVELLDRLAMSIPVGVTLKTVTQQGIKLTLLGTSQSNARVSAYLQSLEGMELFVKPELKYVRAARGAAAQVESYEYAIQVSLDNTRNDDLGGGENQAEAG